MPKKKEYTLYTFKELSEKAQQKAIEDFRDDPTNTWDDDDGDMLTETFEQDLQDHFGLGRMKVGWSLGYCQGDGVCFWGPVTVSEFLEREKEEKQFEMLLKMAQEGLVSVKITREGRDCHYNSMDVEIESFATEENFQPEDLREKISEWNDLKRRAIHDWEVEKLKVLDKNRAPIVEWERNVKEYERHMAQGPRAWSPRIQDPGPKPEPLRFPYPSEPVIPVPDWLLEVKQKAEAGLKELERQVTNFQGYLQERIQEISQELEKNGYAEMEYHRTDEYITELLENRDFEYLKTGERWDQ